MKIFVNNNFFLVSVRKPCFCYTLSLKYVWSVVKHIMILANFMQEKSVFSITIKIFVAQQILESKFLNFSLEKNNEMTFFTFTLIFTYDAIIFIFNFALLSFIELRNMNIKHLLLFYLYNLFRNIFGLKQLKLSQWILFV